MNNKPTFKINVDNEDNIWHNYDYIATIKQSQLIIKYAIFYLYVCNLYKIKIKKEQTY